MVSGWVDMSIRPKGMTKREHASLLDTQDLLKRVDKRKEEFMKDKRNWTIIQEISARYSIEMNKYYS